MRDIKYRVWDKDLCKYVTGAEFGLARMSIKPDDENGSIFSLDTLFPGRYIFEQYTGLKDKNGVEIYEGDIVKIYNGRKLESAFLVQFDESNGTYVFSENEDMDSAVFSGFPVWAKYLVIGNIHENPELLNPCDSTELNERSKNETTE